jgi:hypothetical protein
MLEVTSEAASICFLGRKETFRYANMTVCAQNAMLVTRNVIVRLRNGALFAAEIHVQVERVHVPQQVCEVPGHPLMCRCGQIRLRPVPADVPLL